MRLLADENVRPAHVLALISAGHDIVRVDEVLEKGVSDDAVLESGISQRRVVLTYDRKDFADTTDHAGVLILSETMSPRDLRQAVNRIEHVYPTLEEVVEFLSDWV